MSLIEDLKKEVLNVEANLSGWPYAERFVFMNQILSGKYGTEIMLDYLDFLGGDSVEFVRKQQEKGIQRKD